jgi:hypothetical protein
VQSPSLLGAVISTPALPNPSLAQDPPSSPTESMLSTTNSLALCRAPHRLQVKSTDGQKAVPAVRSSPLGFLLQSVLPSIRGGHRLPRRWPSLSRLFNCALRLSNQSESLHTVCVPILSCFLVNAPPHRLGQPSLGSGDQQPARECLSGQQLQAPA